MSGPSEFRAPDSMARRAARSDLTDTGEKSVQAGWVGVAQRHVADGQAGGTALAAVGDEQGEGPGDDDGLRRSPAHEVDGRA